MIPAPREEFDVVWRGDDWRRRTSAAPAPAPGPAPFLVFPARPKARRPDKRERQRERARQNRAPWSAARKKRRLWAVLDKPATVRGAASYAGMTRAAAGAWLSKAVRAGIVVVVEPFERFKKGSCSRYMRAPHKRHAINFPPIPRAALARTGTKGH